MHEMLDGVRRSPGGGFTRRGILAALGGLGLDALLRSARAQPGKRQRRRKDRRKGSATSNLNRVAPHDVCAGHDSPCLAFPILAAGVACPFAVQVEVSGKAKVLELPGDRMIATAPGQDAIITNLDDPSKQVTLNITGAFHSRVGPNGEIIVVATGRNLIGGPLLEPPLVLTQGRATFVAGPENLQPPLVVKGRVTDICTLIA